jgi:ABC-type multidrug transport system fused ATPase/permease subunit
VSRARGRVFRFTIEALVRIAGISGYMFYRSWKLASVACLVIPVVAAVNRLYGRWMQKNAARVQVRCFEASVG